MRSIITGWKSWNRQLNEENSDHLERLPQSRVPAAVFLLSVLGLYFELVMIRWHGSTAHVFAIFKNVSLLSCFLGLGIGYALAPLRRSIGLAGVLPLLAVQIVLFGLIASTIGGTKVNPVSEQLIMGLRSEKWNWIHPVAGNLFLAGIFVLNAAMFIPVGYATGRLMRRMPALQGYSLNLLGSLAGIGLFFALSWMWSPPIVWIALVALMICPFLTLSPKTAGLVMASMTIGFLMLGVAGKVGQHASYSPYQVVTLGLPKPTSELATPVIRVNHSFFQDIIDCRPEATAKNADLKMSADYYNLPYAIQKNPGDVLIVGAGAGNDVAAALRNGAKTVTAVEIDPAIQGLGRSLHPERPYQDPRTRPVVSDARTHIRQTDDKYDTIVYGLLDRHTNLGSMTNVRLDSFVYTREAFKEAVDHLSPGGLLVVSYLTMDTSQGDKLYAMMKQAFPAEEPRVLSSIKGYTFMTGPGLLTADFKNLPTNVTDVSDKFRARPPAADIATDDWPYFYMQERTYPVTYALMIGVLLTLSVWMVRKRVGDLKLANARNAAFFFLGAGFMLIETKVITELGLTFGNTWAVIGIAIAGVLIMAFLANLYVSKFGPVNVGLCFALLGLALGAGLYLSWSGTVLPANKLLTPAVLVAPLFFAGLIFSSLLARSGGLGDALAANLFGGMLGGFLEYNSMYWGLSSLYPLGMGLYGLALACFFFDRRNQAAKPETPTGDVAPERRAA
jgi:spermidine synthase